MCKILQRFHCTRTLQAIIRTVAAKHLGVAMCGHVSLNFSGAVRCTGCKKVSKWASSAPDGGVVPPDAEKGCTVASWVL